MAIPAYQIPTWAPADELKAVTPSDTAVLTGNSGESLQNGCKLHNVGTSGVCYVDGNKSGVNVEIYIPQGGFAPILVSKVYATGLGAGVSLVAVW